MITKIKALCVLSLVRDFMFHTSVTYLTWSSVASNIDQIRCLFYLYYILFLQGIVCSLSLTKLDQVFAPDIGLHVATG